MISCKCRTGLERLQRLECQNIRERSPVSSRQLQTVEVRGQSRLKDFCFDGRNLVYCCSGGDG